jgi:short-subunit dehydrogenase
MNRLVAKYGPWAVVTGASSGIGEVFARRLARDGINVVLVARRERQLKTLANTLEAQHGVRVRNHFGSLMQERSKGGIIFVSSTLGFSGVPLWSNYVATKAFDHILAEGIGRELKRHGISVLAVTPGPTRTEFWRKAPSRLLPFSSPERVVNVALRKLGRRSSVTVGWLNSLIVFSTRLLPRSWNTRIFGVVAKLLKRATASDDDKTVSNNHQATEQFIHTH